MCVWDRTINNQHRLQIRDDALSPHGYRMLLILLSFDTLFFIWNNLRSHGVNKQPGHQNKMLAFMILQTLDMFNLSISYISYQHFYNMCHITCVWADRHVRWRRGWRWHDRNRLRTICCPKSSFVRSEVNGELVTNRLTWTRHVPETRTTKCKFRTKRRVV